MRSDVWSAGLSLLELATNKFPFPHEIGPIDLIFYITQGDVSSIHNSLVPPSISQYSFPQIAAESRG